TDVRVRQCLERLRARPAARAPRAQGSPSRLVARRRRALVFLRLKEVWAFEAAERLAYVHTSRGRFDVDLSLSAVEASFGQSLLRVHRSWLVNADYVKELEGTGSEMQLLVGSPEPSDGGVRVPVARERAPTVREALLVNAAGIRSR